jgi:hypothetical protein
MTLKFVKFNNWQLLVQYTTDSDSMDNICIDKIFYNNVNVEPLFDEDYLQKIVDLVMTGDME